MLVEQLQKQSDRVMSGVAGAKFAEQQQELDERAVWELSPEEAVARFATHPEKGLDERQVAERLKLHGPNIIESGPRRSTLKIFVDQFRSLLVALLAVASILSFVFGNFIEGAAILVVIALNALIGFAMELRAVTSMEALKKLSKSFATVKRGGETKRVPAEELVPGDLVLVEGGDLVPADLRLLEASKLRANESTFTGESAPVSKSAQALEGEIELADRRNLLFKGTALSRGSAAGVVTATGMDTELGRISRLVSQAEAEVTPLEERLSALGQRLAWLVIGLAFVIAALGALRGRDLLLMVQTAIALAVAAVPEGLPIVATVALARGMWRMARRNAVIKNLSAVETLGSTSVILCDKTGTLTENRMTVAVAVCGGKKFKLAASGFEGGQGELDFNPQQKKLLTRLLRVGVLCNNASDSGLDGGAEVIGDPMEAALLAAGRKAGLERNRLIEQFPELREEAFDPAVKMMATYHRRGTAVLVAVKGAPEAVIAASSVVAEDDGEVSLGDEGRRRLALQAKELAGSGLRVLALAEREVAEASEAPYRDLTFLGMVGLLDPPKQRVREALRECREAGITVIMVTGDHADTAKHIADELELGGCEEDPQPRVLQGAEIKPVARCSANERERCLNAKVVARASPEEKLELLRLHQKSGAIVAMTGDGVNDAPALKKADIGVAMGKRGTDVAREAADMVLSDDNFSTIAAAVAEGRAIYNNIRMFVVYLLSCNVSEILVVGAAAIANLPLPLLPLQILFLNLVTDVFPALALGFSEGEAEIMKRMPRDRQEQLMTRRSWLLVFSYGGLITAAVFAAFLWALFYLELPSKTTVTISFLTLALAQLWHVFNMAHRESPLFINEVTRNGWVWGALLLCLGLLAAALYVPAFAAVLHLEPPNASGWVLIGFFGFLPLMLPLLLRAVRRGAGLGGRRAEEARQGQTPEGSENG